MNWWFIITKTNIIADSSFYICFIDDISDYNSLIQLLTWREFKFIIGNIINEEISKSVNYKEFQHKFESNLFNFSYDKYREIFKPFFSYDEIKKGEIEVMVISYIFNFLARKIIVILDEIWARNYFYNNFPEIRENMIGTIGFIENCTCNQKIFSYDSAIFIFKKIKKSKFRIKDNILNNTIKKIQEIINGKAY